MVQENVNLVPTDVINAGLPGYQFGPDIARMLAQTSFGNLANIRQAEIAAAASGRNAQTSAGATLGAAGIGAQSRVDAQLIATNGAIAQANARMRTDATLAAAGDINAYRRLLQDQQYTSQLENNKNKMEIAKLAGSGSLFDNIAARYAAAGQGALPQIGGAFLGGGIQNVSAPTGNAPLSIEKVLSYLQPAAMQSGGGGGFDFSSLAGLFGGGGGTNLAPLAGIGDIFAGLNQQIYDSILGTQGPLIVDTPSSYAAPVDPTGPAPGSPEAIAATQATWEQLLAAPGSGSVQRLHAGGRLKSGESGIVGDDRGRLTPFSELVRNVNGEVEITPLGGRGLGNFRGRFHTGTGPHRHEMGDPANPAVDTEPFIPMDDPRRLDPDPVAPVKDPMEVKTIFPERIYESPARTLAATSSPWSLEGMKRSDPRGYVRRILGHNPTAGEMIAFANDRNIYDDYTPEKIGVLPGETPVEPDGLEHPPDETPTTTTTPTTTSTYTPPTNGVLSDVSNIPALEALRSGQSGQSIFDFGQNYFSRPDQGIAPLPSPFNFGKPFLTMPGSQQQDVLDFYKSQFALKPEDTLSMFFASQPGYRRFGGSPFAF